MILFKRPVITVLVLYVLIIILLNYFGNFSAINRSSLIGYTDNIRITLTGKIINEPVIKNNRQQFILETTGLNNNPIKEKTFVYAPLFNDLKYGDIIELSGKLQIPPSPAFPGNFDYGKYLNRQNIYTLFYASDFELLEQKPSSIKSFALKTKNDISNKLTNYFKLPYSSILQAMLIGDKSSLEQETKNIFVNTGLIHILVVSGLHVGFGVVIFIFLFKLFNLPLKYVYLLTIPAIFFYTIMTGANPPAIRASIMASCILLSLVLNREPLIYNAIALSALIILIFNPQELFTASFQMSFLATLGIIYLYPKINNIFGKIKNKYLKWFWNVASVTLSAQIALIPILIFYFGKLSVISFVANILIVPIVGFLIGLSLVFYISTFLSGYLALAFAILLSGLLNIILGIIQILSNFNFSMITVKIPTVLEILFYYFTIIIILEFKHNKRILFGLFFLILIMFITSNKNNDFTKTFESSKNITTHISDKSSNIIIFKQIKKDKYYFSNLQQYLLGQGIKSVDQFCTNSNEDIKENLPDIKIKEVLYSD
ncbi:MAG: ComEC/Rec2 family competence protein [Endomicrobiaceae bacterium]|nr:ComEC/Rec2 family competence protein [Endomicrobiaceae bacterium]